MFCLQRCVDRRNFVGLVQSVAKMCSSPIKDLQINVPQNRPFRVSVEGNIGAGKSTLIEYFKKFDDIEVHAEPVDWWRNVNGYNLLELLYSDVPQWINMFQTYVMLTRVQIQTSKPTNPNVKVQMFERSVQNNRFCFLEQAHLNGYLHSIDYTVLDKWYDFVKKYFDIDLDLIVYLRSTPEVVYERMKARGRPEEMSVTLEYLQQLHDSHEKWLMSKNESTNSIPVVILDANQTLEDIMREYKMNESRILGQERAKSAN